MSSAAIHAQIVQCENNITQCRADILALEKKVEEQTGAYNKFIQKSDAYSDTIVYKQKKANAVYEHSGRSVLAQKLYEQMSPFFNEGAWHEKKQTLISIEDGMSVEIRKNKRDLEDARLRLLSLQRQLASLQAQYSAAVHAEEAEAAAAAAAMTRK